MKPDSGGQVFFCVSPIILEHTPGSGGKLKGISDDPGTGGPYVMWGDTPYAHIMVPVALDE